MLEDTPDIKAARDKAKQRRARLHDYRKDYTVEEFISDLDVYFEKEVDFDYDKVRQEVSLEGKLEELVEKAKHKDTHPVSEFVCDMVKKSTKK